jgi:hypothetical protein
MHQTKKGNQWHFGMKAQVGMDSKTKMIHSVVATAVNVADATVLPELLHGEETRVWGDQAYRGQTDVIQQVARQAKDCTHRRYRYKERYRRRGAGEESDQVENALAGGARVWRDESEVRFYQGALPRSGEERQPTVRDLRLSELVPGPSETAAHRSVSVGGRDPTDALVGRSKPTTTAIPRVFSVRGTHGALTVCAYSEFS